MNRGRQSWSRVNMTQPANTNKTFGYGFATAQNPAWSMSQVLLATGGMLIHGRSDVIFRSISTDSRTLEAGDLFLALAGDRFDGHDYIDKALQNGAAGMIVSKPPEHAPPIPLISVKDTLRTLGDLAGYRRSQMPRLQVIGITGSSGKTTVKEMVATILQKKFRVLKTQGNFNNLVGLPLSLLPVDYAHDVAVLEMGMNRPGEIARLAEIADPDIGCIANVQDAHLAGLKDIRGVAEAKGELFSGMKAWGKLAVNIDDRNVRRLANRHSHEKILFGRGKKAMVRATQIRNCGEKGMRFNLHIGSQKERILLRSLGEHNVMNALAAAAITRGMGLSLSQITLGLSLFKPYDKRMQVEHAACGIKVVNDTYNANPSSMLAALQALKGLSRDNKTIVVLGDMLELGKQSVAAHRYVGESAASIGFDYLFAVGSYAGTVVSAARDAGMTAEQAQLFATKDAIADTLRRFMHDGTIQKGDWILVKGSRGMRMEVIVEAIAQMAQKETV